MTSNDDFDRRLTTWLDAEAPQRAPEYVLPSTFAVTARTRQRPGWVFPERWIPMQTTTRLAGVPRTAMLLALLVAILIIAALGFTAAGGRLPPLGPPSNPIAFTSSRDGHQQAYVMSADGSHMTRLSDRTANDHAGAWSPDGQRLVFDSDRNGQHGIYVMNADGSHVRPLWADARPMGLESWSPDGKHIAFHVDSSGTGCFEVWTMDADGSNRRQLTPEGSCNWAPAWSPDGTRLAFGSTRDGNFDIYLMSPDGSAQTPVGNRSTRNDAFPVFSPDGTKIAYTSWDANLDPTTAEVYVMNADGTGRTRLTNNGVEDSYPAWSPDGTKLAFQSARDGNLEIYVMNVDGTSPIRLTNDPADDVGAMWH